MSSPNSPDDQKALVTKLHQIAIRVHRVLESPAHLEQLRDELYTHMGRERLDPRLPIEPLQIGRGEKLAWLVAIHDGLVPTVDGEYDGEVDPGSRIFAPPYPGNSEDRNVLRSISLFVRSLVHLTDTDLDSIEAFLEELARFVLNGPTKSAEGSAAGREATADALPEGSKVGADPKPKRPREEWMAQAMLLVRDKPHLSDAEIARKVGVHKGTLARSPEYRAAAALARGTTDAVPKGKRVADPESGQSDIEAYADGDEAPRSDRRRGRGGRHF